MRNYSPFIELLYDQENAVGDLGRGTHYSVLRAPCWHSPGLKPLPSARLHDFALLWDEDHNQRIIPVVERIFFEGLLSPIMFIGERKATVWIVVSPAAGRALGAGLAGYQEKLEAIAQAQDDPWLLEVALFGKQASRIVDVSDEEVNLYLQHIHLLWRLGSKEIGEREVPGMDCDER